MHDTEKVIRAGTGHLTRTQNKEVINPFPEGVAIIKKVRTSNPNAPKRSFEGAWQTDDNGDSHRNGEV